MSTACIIDHRKTLTKEEIKRIVEENNIEFIKLEFCDINGTMKNLSIPCEQLESAMNNEIMLDGSSIKGFRSIETSDMYFYPDLNTFAIIPWRSDDDVKVARFICDIHNADGTPFEGCPRCNLKKMIARAEKLGYTMNVGPEAEFFIFKQDENGNATINTYDKAGYYSAAPVDKGENLRRIMVKTLKAMGFEVEASHHEVGPGQNEIAFKFDDALKTADAEITFKQAIKAIVANMADFDGFDYRVTFMPKPFFGESGSGMHCHQSLFKDGENIFYDENSETGLSQEAMWFIGGLLKHSAAITAVTNPIVNSYKRLVPGYEAPVYISYGIQNRSTLIRVPAARGKATRIEYRSPDPTCNPYLAFAVMLEAGMDGIKNKIDPGEAIEFNIYELSDEEREEMGIELLPSSLWEAYHTFEESEIMKEALGDHIFNAFLSAKYEEWDEYRVQVFNYEHKKYLNL